jgi:hypothetical protein
MTLLYRNALREASDLDGWAGEGPVAARDADDGLELSGSGGCDEHWTLWCPEVFPDRVRITWEFSPRAEPGLAMLFFGAAAAAGGGIFDDGLAHRTGQYPQYHSGDIRTLHVSYFRRRWEDERAFHTCNLRKSPGFHLVAQGADPLPPVVDAKDAFYRIEVVKDAAKVAFAIDDLPLFSWTDDESTGPRVRGGRIGFRQMSPLVARYRNLEVHAL